VLGEIVEKSEIDDCRFLFLTDLRETIRNLLQIVVSEGLACDAEKSIEVASVLIPTRTPTDNTGESRIHRRAGVVLIALAAPEHCLNPRAAAWFSKGHQ
jgi:hypothetical protein